MELSDILSADRIAVDIAAASKKSLLEKAAELLAQAPSAAGVRDIFESLCQRERLGSTALGHGVAIPHGRVPSQPDLAGALIRLQNAIDFDGPDHEKVDLFFALAVPSECTDMHLQMLAEIAKRFGDPERREALRIAASPQEVLELLIQNGDEDTR